LRHNSRLKQITFVTKTEFLVGVGWSGPPSFVSSSGPSSPNGSASLIDYFVGGEPTAPSSLSASLLSEEGAPGLLNYFSGMLPTQIAAGMFPPNNSSCTTPGATIDDFLNDRSDEEDHAPDVTVTEEPVEPSAEPSEVPAESEGTSPSSGGAEPASAKSMSL
jgi:hypothetical protein